MSHSSPFILMISILVLSIYSDNICLAIKDIATLDVRYPLLRSLEPNRHSVDEEIPGPIFPRMMHERAQLVKHAEYKEASAHRRFDKAQKVYEGAEQTRQKALQRITGNGISTRGQHHTYNQASNMQLDAAIDVEEARQDILEQERLKRAGSSDSATSVQGPESRGGISRDRSLPKTSRSKGQSKKEAESRPQRKRQTRLQTSLAAKQHLVAPSQPPSTQIKRSTGAGRTGKQTSRSGGRTPDMRKGSNIERLRKVIEWNRQNPGAEIEPSTMGRPVGSTRKRAS